MFWNAFSISSISFESCAIILFCSCTNFCFLNLVHSYVAVNKIYTFLSYLFLFLCSIFFFHYLYFIVFLFIKRIEIIFYWNHFSEKKNQWKNIIHIRFSLVRYGQIEIICYSLGVHCGTSVFMRLFSMQLLFVQNFYPYTRSFKSSQ